MKLKRFGIGTLGLIAVSGLAWSCSSKSDDCNANLNCAPYGGEAGTDSGSSGAGFGASGKGGASGTSGASNSTSGTTGTSGEGGTDDPDGGSGGATPPACDGSLSPDSDACVISDKYGIFVSPDADAASADGSQAHPFVTVTTALASITTIKHVYLCAGEYTAEPDTLTIPDRVSIYGGFTCEGGNWNYDSSVPAHVSPPSAIGATITDAKVGVLLQDLRIDAANADDGGASSFGLIVSGSQGVVMRRTEIRAGKATSGKDGALGAPSADGVPPVAEQNGTAACSTMPKAGVASTQSACGSKGGDGGLGYLTFNGGNGLPGIPGENLTAPGKDNGGVGATLAGAAYPGTNGDPGLPGKPGNTGMVAPTIGTFTSTGYLAASGGDGTNGNPGQGGGGGGASKGSGSCVGASGGAGGMGGCAGSAGTGGIGGGASVAVLSWNSGLTIDGATLVAGPGGAGGNGGAASPGGSGSAGGGGGGSNTSNGVASAGLGGRGGDGGNGGNGAGGSGGPSIALFWSGTKPVQMGNTHLNPAEGGKLGQGGRLGTDPTKWGPDGKAGASESILPKDTP